MGDLLGGDAFMWLMYHLWQAGWKNVGVSLYPHDVPKLLRAIADQHRDILQANDCTVGEFRVSFFFEQKELEIYLRGKPSPESESWKGLVHIKLWTQDIRDMTQTMENCFRFADEMVRKGYTVDINNGPPQIVVYFQI